MIVVTAAGGRTGAAVVRSLWSRGHRVRALVGGSRDYPDLASLAADVVPTDLRDAAALETLLAGAEALYLIWPNFDPHETAGATALLAAATAGRLGPVDGSARAVMARASADLRAGKPVAVRSGRFWFNDWTAEWLPGGTDLRGVTTL